MPPPIRNAILEPGDRCYTCAGERLWRSVYRVWICRQCHPPASPGLVEAEYPAEVVGTGPEAARRGGA
jgi:ribosomal protein L37AE/L43A